MARIKKSEIKRVNLIYDPSDGPLRAYLAEILENGLTMADGTLFLKGRSLADYLMLHAAKNLDPNYKERTSCGLCPNVADENHCKPDVRSQDVEVRRGDISYSSEDEEIRRMPPPSNRKSRKSVSDRFGV